MDNLMKMGAVIGAGAITAVAATTIASGQAATAESWRLADINGSALPFLAEEEGDCRETISRGGLTLADDGTWTLTLDEEEMCGTEAAVETETEQGRYVAEGATIRFLDEDGEVEEQEEDEDLDLDELRAGTRGDGSLTIRLADGETELRFIR